MKTLSIIAVAGLASVAAADTLWAANNSSTGSIQTTGLTSGTYTFSFSDGAFWDVQGDPDNVVYSLDLNALLGGVSGADAFVTGIGYDVNLETVGASWLSEATFNFNDEIFLTPGVGNDAPGAGNFAEPVIDLGDDAGLPDILAAGGILNIELFESFDDVADAIDAFGDGSITLVVDYKPVPAPAGLAVLGLGGLAAARRRR